MIVLVTGDRWWHDYQLILCRIRSWHEQVPIHLLIHGACRGADLMADRAAEYLDIPRDPNPADWDRHGPSAGPIRNRQMFHKHPVDLVLAFHDHIQSSKGTRDMIRVALGSGCLVELTSQNETIFPYTIS